MSLTSRIKAIAKIVLPGSWRYWMRRMQVRVTERPPYKMVRWGSLRRVKPIHEGFSIARGTYVDRYYIERFLEQNAECVKGRVLEFSENDYTLRFGGDRVTQSDVIDVRADHEPATIVADITKGDHLAADAFDCIILTQVLNFVFDVPAAIRTLHRILKPGGSLLVSVAGISQIVPDEFEYCGDYWRFTRVSIRRLFEAEFPPENVHLEVHGNVLASIAFLHGLAAEELSREELDYCDPNFEVVLLLRVVKAGGPVDG